MTNSRKGSLVVVGTGISAGHPTRESICYIELADIVLCCLPDIATERWIQKLNPRTEDLTLFYADDKPRSQTYKEMTDRILHLVRDNCKVCVAFYGHPGIFVTSTHAAIEQARAEGFEAHMIPAVSSLDCLFADLGIDPGLDGCQILEATHYICQNRFLDKHSSVILLQVGCVGDWGWSSKGYDGRNVSLLSSRLQQIYGADYEVTVYQASTVSNTPPLIKTVKLKNLESACVSESSTLYVPPIESASFDLELISFFQDQQLQFDAHSANVGKRKAAKLHAKMLNPTRRPKSGWRKKQ